MDLLVGGDWQRIGLLVSDGEGHGLLGSSLEIARAPVLVIGLESHSQWC